LKAIICLTSLAILAGCASSGETVTQDTEQAVRDFIAVRELATTERIRTANDDQWQDIDENFILYLTRHEAYLVEFAWRCRELHQYPVVPDMRDSSNTIRAKFDTLRGCRIAKIYSLTETEVTELRDIGESPGSRN
jgi:hypothetical protein